MNSALCYIPITMADRACLEDPAIDDWRGGNGDLFRMMREVYRTALEQGQRMMAIVDWEIVRRIRLYSAASYGSGTWQTHVRRWRQYVPDSLQDPQGSLF
jgi:hypothetical protein